MKILYKSTRNSENMISCSEAIIKGIAEDGGLYVPTEIPVLDKKVIQLADMSYKELAYYIIEKYFPCFSEEELKSCIDNAYDDKFETDSITPLVEKGGINFLELYHGPTLAFKDVALSFLPHIMKAAIKKQKLTKNVVILTATSGDTGKAALVGFKNVEGTKIIVFFPKDGVSDIQKMQMITQEGDNVFVVGIDGNFDDAQSGVKEIFNDKQLIAKLYEKGYMFSSANSINIARLVPQIVYYFYSYANLLKSEGIKENENINVVVPTGNFGNILAGYYAKKMGLPINKFICASNENNVLSDFFNTGIYDKKRPFFTTNSPSMDILISSNLERFLYEISGKDESLINELMKKLKEEGRYEINETMRENLKDFYGGFATEKEVLESINEVYRDSKYVMDTHTAVAYSVYKDYRENTKDNTKTIVLSTASPFKFPKSVAKAIDLQVDKIDDFQCIQILAQNEKILVPKSIKNLKDREILHKITCKKDDMKLMIRNFLKV